MYQGITHRGSLKGKDFLTTEFLRGVLAFGNHLGPIFIQLSESFGPGRKEEIFTFLRSLPVDLQFFVEVRHPEWFRNEAIFRELLSTLSIPEHGHRDYRYRRTQGLLPHAPDHSQNLYSFCRE